MLSIYKKHLVNTLEIQGEAKTDDQGQALLYSSVFGFKFEVYSYIYVPTDFRAAQIGLFSSSSDRILVESHLTCEARHVNICGQLYHSAEILLFTWCICKTYASYYFWQLLAWLANTPTDIESYIRPGCIILTVYLRMEKSSWEKVVSSLAFS